MTERAVIGDQPPWAITSDYVRAHHAEMRMDPGVVDLVCALLDTGVVGTSYSCEGHFRMDRSGFCHHNQMAQIHLEPKDWPKTALLVREIMESVVIDGLEVRSLIVQNRGDPEFDEPNLVWKLEFIPQGFWNVRNQADSVLVMVADGWTEERARALILEAFHATIEVCREGEWRGKVAA